MTKKRDYFFLFLIVSLYPGIEAIIEVTHLKHLKPGLSMCCMK